MIIEIEKGREFLKWFKETYKDVEYPWKDERISYYELPSNLKSLMFTQALNDYFGNTHLNLDN